MRPAAGADAGDGAVEFIHKSFGEFLCAKRLQESLEEWVLVDQRSRRRGFLISTEQLGEEIYDLLGYGGLTPEIVTYLMALLKGSDKFQPIELFQRLEEFYLDWCQGEFINAYPKNLPQNKMLQLRSNGSNIGLREVDIFAGLNVMILLLKLNWYAQNNDELKGKIIFYPCGEEGTEGFDPYRLLRIISYSNSVTIDSCLKILGFFLSGANLSGANLSGVNLSYANLSSANLSRANLRHANLRHANLSSANLSSANLSGAYLSSANLSGAYLSYANLSGAYLSGAYLSGANLNDANLSDANLRGANLSGAYFSYTNLSGANLSNISWNKYTKRENVTGWETAINVPDGFFP